MINDEVWMGAALRQAGLALWSWDAAAGALRWSDSAAALFCLPETASLSDPDALNPHLRGQMDACVRSGAPFPAFRLETDSGGSLLLEGSVDPHTGTLCGVARGPVLADDTLRPKGISFFERVAETLGRTLDADCFLVGERLTDERSRTVALWTPEGIQSETDLALTDPLESTLAEQLGMADCSALTLKRRSGEPIGVLAALWKRSAPRDGSAQDALRLVAARAAAKLERRETERNRRQSDAYYQVIFEATPDAITFTRIEDGTYLDVNPGFCAAYGYTREEVIGRSALDIGIWESLEDRERMVGRLRAGETFIGEPARFRRKDGSPVCVLLSSCAVELNGVRCMVSLARDVTQRVRDEKELRRQMHMQECAQHVARMGVWEFDHRSGEYYWSEGMYRLHDMDPRAGIPSRDEARALFPADSMQLLVEAVQRSAVEEGATSLELPVLTATGRRILVGVSLRTECEGGMPLRTYGAVQDITEQKRADLALRESEERFRSLIEYASDLILVLDPGGRILYHSPSLARVLGYGADDIVGTPMLDFIHPDDLPGVRDALRQVCERPDTLVRAEARVLHADGSWRVMESIGRNLCETSLGGIVLNCRDQTERRQAERATERQVGRLKTLRAVDRAITGSVDLRVSLESVLDQLTRLDGIAGAALRVLRPDATFLELIAGSGVVSRGGESFVILGSGPAGRAALERRAVALGDDELASEDIPLRLASGATPACYGAYPLLAQGRVNGVLELLGSQPLPQDDEWRTFLETLLSQIAMGIENALLVEDLQRSHADLIHAYDATIAGWAHALELRDQETRGHSQRVTEMTLRLARGMGIGGAELSHLRRGALLHDIGKMGIPDSILLTERRLSAAEREIIERHPVYAREMLSAVPFLQPALDVPYCHHERWDGSGYPRGLRGEEIPLAARIFAVVDVYDALRTDRPYRGAWPIPQVCAYLQEHSSSHFDPQVVAQFLRIFHPEWTADTVPLRYAV